MKKIHTAANEVEALMLQGLLEQAGIPVLLRSRQIPGYADVLKRATGVWGDLLVPDEQEAEARALVLGYLASRNPEANKGERPRGIIVPVVTLFDEQGGVDEEANVRHIEWLITQGIHGLFVLGTTGEFTSLSCDERRRLAELAVTTARGRVPVLVGCSSSWTDEAVAYAEHAESIGAQGVVSVLPFYWIPPDRSIYEHFRRLAASTSLPVYIYNYPALTGRSIPPVLTARLAADYPNIAGIKDTVDSIAHIQETLAMARRHRPDFVVLCGMDYHLLNTLLLGGDGGVLGTANFMPDPLVQLYANATTGRIEEAADGARRLALLPQLFAGDAPPFVIIKEAMVMAGRAPRATVRPPAVPLSTDERADLRRRLDALGILR
jgi:4-hydroxy-tetrahydrodipicolinate synthase